MSGSRLLTSHITYGLPFEGETEGFFGFGENKSNELYFGFYTHPRTPVLAAADGIVISKRHRNKVIIAHGPKDATYYSLIDSCVKFKQKVIKGDVIGHSRNSLRKRPQIHFQALVLYKDELYGAYPKWDNEIEVSYNFKRM